MASDLGLHCLPVTRLGVSSFNGLISTSGKRQPAQQVGIGSKYLSGNQ